MAEQALFEEAGGSTGAGGRGVQSGPIHSQVFRSILGRSFANLVCQHEQQRPRFYLPVMLSPCYVMFYLPGMLHVLFGRQSVGFIPLLYGLSTSFVAQSRILHAVLHGLCRICIVRVEFVVQSVSCMLVECNACM